MRRRNAAKVDAVVDQLLSQLTPALYDLGFFRATIDNPIVGEKIAESFSGHALDISIRAVAAKLVLFVTRTWDKSGRGIPVFLKFAGGAGAHIEGTRKSRHTDWSDESLGIGTVQRRLDALDRYSKWFTTRDEFQATLRYRNEHLAHLLEGSSDISQRLARKDIILDDVSYKQLIKLAEQTANAISWIEQIWKFSVRSPEDFIRVSEQYTTDFWRFLPVLRDLE